MINIMREREKMLQDSKKGGFVRRAGRASGPHWEDLYACHKGQERDKVCQEKGLAWAEVWRRGCLGYVRVQGATGMAGQWVQGTG